MRFSGSISARTFHLFLRCGIREAMCDRRLAHSFVALELSRVLKYCLGERNIVGMTGLGS